MLEVMGQTVHVDDLTVFDGADATTLQGGNIVAVSGFVDAAGDVHAARVELKAASFDVLATKEVAVKGLVKNPTADAFDLGNLKVSVPSQALDAAIVAQGGVKANDFVEVKSTQTPAGNVLTASAVKLEDRRVAVGQGGRASLEGIVTRFASAADFDVNGQPVTTTAQTTFEPAGKTAADLAQGDQVKVKGSADATGVVVASQVSFRLARNIKIEAAVSGVDAPAGTVTVFGTSGLAVLIDASTQLRDGKKQGQQDSLSLAELVTGSTPDRVKIRGFQREDGKVVAARLERDDTTTDRVRLQGSLDAKPADASALKVLGITVDASGASVVFRRADDSATAPDAFMAALTAGTLVKAAGTFDSATGKIVATEVQIEVEQQLEQQVEVQSAFQFEMEVENEVHHGVGIGGSGGGAGGTGGGAGGGGGGGGRGFDKVHKGRIDRIGPAFVNGQEIRTDTALVTIDSKARGEADLAVGMPAKVEVLVEAGGLRAARVQVNAEVRGPITAVPLTLDATGQPVGGTLPDSGELEVMHQRVKLDDGTVLADDSAAAPPTHDLDARNLLRNEIVVVRGIRDDKGVVHASRVERKAHVLGDLPQADRELALKGTVAFVAATTFSIGGQTVDFSAATIDPAIGAGNLKDGLVVEARGTLANDGTLKASGVQLDDNGVREAEGLVAKVAGMITGYAPAAAPNEFEVSGQRVSWVDGATTFLKGTSADLALGRLVEAEGTVTNGALGATTISFERARNMKVLAPVDSVSAGTATVLGMTVTIDSSTLMKDKRDGLRTFGPADLQPADWVDVRAFKDDQGNLVAAKLTRVSARTAVRLQGSLDIAASTPDDLKVQGVDVPTLNMQQFKNAAGSNLRDSTTFLADAVAAGHHAVRVRGARDAAGHVSWDRAQVESEHQFENENAQENEFEFELENELEGQK
jgi:hypothetical protein